MGHNFDIELILIKQTLLKLILGIKNLNYLKHILIYIDKINLKHIFNIY